METCHGMRPRRRPLAARLGRRSARAAFLTFVLAGCGEVTAPDRTPAAEASDAASLRIGTASRPADTGLALSKVSGDLQSAAPGAVLADPLVVRVSAAGSGYDVPGVPVAFSFYGVDGSLVGSVTVHADAEGLARVSWKLADEPGTQRAAATAPSGAMVEFTAKAVSGWTNRASLLTARFGHATAVVDGIIYVMGGLVRGYPEYCQGAISSVEAYDPATDTWTPRSPMPARRFYTSGAAVLDGKIYVPGGWACEGSMDNLFVYDVATDTWSDAGPLPGWTSSGFAHVIDGALYILNGWTGTAYSGDLHRYDPSTRTWTRLATVRLGHAYGASGVIGGRIVLLGGEIQTRALDIYDPATDAWTAGPEAPYWLQHNSGAVIDERFYVVGGSYELGTDPYYYSDRVLIFDPAAAAYAEGPPLPFPRQFAGVAAVDGTLYVIGGEGPLPNPTGTVQAWTP